MKIKTVSELEEYIEAKKSEWIRSDTTGYFSQKFIKVDFTGCHLDGVSFGKSTFFSCVLNSGSFIGSDFSECSFMRSTAIDGNFTGAIFLGAKIEYCKMQKSLFNDCDFSDVDFAKTDMQHAKMKNAKLKNVRLKELELFGADISECDLREADVEKAAFIGTKFNLAKITSEQKKLILKMKYKSVEQNISLFIVEELT